MSKQHRLTETRKADREAMAKELEALAARYGWQFYRCQYVNPSESVRVHLIGPRGLAASIEFERHSGMTDNYCVPWHFDCKPSNYDADAKLHDCFGWMQAASVNPYHRRKCTVFAQGIDALLRKVETAMQLATGDDGNGNSAFMDMEKTNV